jgi:choline kinase
MAIAGLPLIAHALDHARASGCTEAVVVIGHRGDLVQAAVEAMRPALALRFVENPDVSAPNGLSLLAAEPLVHECFYLQMVDHVFAGNALSRLSAVPLERLEAGRVLIDRSPGDAIDVADATKVRVNGSRILAIGKQVDPWDAIDAGCFVLTRSVFDALRAVPEGEPLTVSSGMRQLVAREALGMADLAGIDWIDVDTPADRAAAERILMASPARTP